MVIFWAKDGVEIYVQFLLVFGIEVMGKRNDCGV
jgi:hypothetical protein